MFYIKHVVLIILILLMARWLTYVDLTIVVEHKDNPYEDKVASHKTQLLHWEREHAHALSHLYLVLWTNLCPTVYQLT